jgi:hypothetical protein
MNDPTVPQAGRIHRPAQVIETVPTDETLLDALTS